VGGGHGSRSVGNGSESGWVRRDGRGGDFIHWLGQDTIQRQHMVRQQAVCSGCSIWSVGGGGGRVEG